MSCDFIEGDFVGGDFTEGDHIEGDQFEGIVLLKKDVACQVWGTSL